MKTLHQNDWTDDDGTVHKNDISVAENAAGLVDFVMSEGAAAYHTILEDAVRTLKDEIQLDLDRGVDYRNTVWRGERFVNKWKQSVREELRRFAFVDEVRSITAAMSGHTLTYEIRVALTDGTTEVLSN